MSHSLTLRTPNEILAEARARVFSGADLPAKVFRMDFIAFGFLEDSFKGGPRFWGLLRRLGDWSGDNRAAVASLDPDHALLSGGRVGAFDKFLADDPQSYNDEFMRPLYPGSPEDLSDATLVGCYPPSLCWAVYADRKSSTLVVGMEREPSPSFEAMAGASGLRAHPLEEMLDITRNDFALYLKPPDPKDVAAYQAYCDEFRRNYSPRQIA